MKKKILSLFLSLLMVVSLAAPAAAAKTMNFSDVTPQNWFYEPVKALYEAGIINGTSDTTFSPQASMTLGHALKMVLLAAGYEEQKPITAHWASGYYLLASELKVLPQGMTDLNRAISRLQIAQIIVNVLDLDRTGHKKPFADTTEEAALILYDHGIFTGTQEGSQLLFEPRDSITRAEISAVIQRTYTLVEKLHFQPAPLPEQPEPPAQDGEYFTFRNQKVYIVEDLPANSYNNELFTINENGFLVYDDENWSCKIGIDVSRYQGRIDWSQVKTVGVDFAILRLGYRGYGTGKMVMDTYFYENLRGALANDIEVGVYFFSQAITPEEAREEARYCMEALEGYDITYPIVFDWEPYSSSYDARTEDLDDTVLTQCAVAFCEEVESQGYEAMVYSNLTYFYLHLDLNQLKDYPFWLAYYPKDVLQPSFYYHFDIWQYGDGGIVPGIKGDVDLNIQFVPKQ